MPVDPATGVAVAKTALEVGKGAITGWGWLYKWLYGIVTITHPHNRDPVKPGWVDMEGTHRGTKGIYWLVTSGREEYWIKCRIILHPDGRWKEGIHIGDHSGPRPCFVSVVWVSEFMHSILSDIKVRSDKGKVWDPLKIKPPSNHFSIVHSIVLQVQ
jgi:hypothetical protein